MSNTAIQNELNRQMDTLPLEQQQQVLQFARALSISTVRGVSGASLLRFGGAIPLDDLKIMEQAIEDGSEQVNLSW
ncbi:MAG: hypothetical protein JWQ02_1068 [Capsulimonas sp.]|jgi:hypothetical protein|nr:hypothetical protein [Capsulimonas sp.]